VKHHPKTWPLQEAKAKFSELVKLVATEGPQIVTVHGQPTVVISKVPSKAKDHSDMSGSDFIDAMRRGQLFEFELPLRPLHLPTDDFSFDEEDELR
jgi:prevent-host-death family protein